MVEHNDSTGKRLRMRRRSTHGTTRWRVEVVIELMFGGHLFILGGNLFRLEFILGGMNLRLGFREGIFV